jgi:hypothetical protein
LARSNHQCIESLTICLNKLWARRLQVWCEPSSRRPVADQRSLGSAGDGLVRGGLCEDSIHRPHDLDALIQGHEWALSETLPEPPGADEGRCMTASDG